MSFELLVRPFQSPQPLAQQRAAVVVVNSGTAPVAVPFCWGEAGAVPAGAPLPDAFDPYQSVDFNTICCQDDYKQKAQETETVRIYGKDDINNTGPYIEQKRPKKIDFDKKDNKCSTPKTPDIVVASIANLFTPAGLPIYGVTDNRPKAQCKSSYTYDYGAKQDNEVLLKPNEVVV